MICQQFNKEIDFFTLNRVVFYRRDYRGKKVKLVRHVCNRCLDWEKKS